MKTENHVSPPAAVSADVQSAIRETLARMASAIPELEKQVESDAQTLIGAGWVVCAKDKRNGCVRAVCALDQNGQAKAGGKQWGLVTLDTLPHDFSPLLCYSPETAARVSRKVEIDPCFPAIAEGKPFLKHLHEIRRDRLTLLRNIRETTETAARAAGMSVSA